jgi:hypothetical protein
MFTAAIVLLCFVSAHGFPQTSNATLGGTVSDASGALIPGVTVTATNTQTGIVSMVVSNETGAYQFASLQTGTYKVTAELPGFQTQTYNNVVLGISQQVRLNFTLQVGTQAQSVEVSVAADTLLATTSASVGAVLPEYKVRDLPLGGRDVLGLVGTTAGTFISGTTASFAGAPSGMTITTRDGIAVNDGRYANGVYSQTYTSTDLVDEVRVIVAPADAETGRGSGQVQMTTRSGTNQFRGALFWTNRNPVLDSNTFANNFNHEQKNYLNRNQFGGRLGGPLIKNRTFFFFLYEGMRSVQREVVVSTVLTGPARQGIYRYFPGVQSANAGANVPTVDLNGNPVRPPTATGDLQTLNVFSRDPYRTGFDPSGWVQRILAKMPLPNDFRTLSTTDGLNTAGYRWVRRYSGFDTFTGLGTDLNRDQINLRIDHQFNANHKLSLVGTREHTWAESGLAPWPDGFNASVVRHPLVYTGSLVSTLSPTLVNEARVGLRRGKMYNPQAWDVPGPSGDAAKTYLGGPVNGIPYIPVFTLLTQHVWNDQGASVTSTPLWTYGDTLSWTRGKHAFKGGVEFRVQHSNSATNANVIPRVMLGGQGIALQGFTNIAGLSGSDQTRAQNLLADLSGSVGVIQQAFTINDTKSLVYKDYRDEYFKYRDLHGNEFSWFFKDDWKIRPSLTLNLGVRYEWYGTPWETKGLIVSPVGGGNGLFGYSGRSFADWFRPGQRGDLMTLQFVGKNSPNPDIKVYPDDWNNVAPAVGFSWSLPWFGKDKTVLRAGYGIGYQGRFAGGNGGTFYSTLAAVPGLTQTAQHFATTIDELKLTNIVLPIPERAPSGKIEVAPLTSRSQSVTGYDNHMSTPYIQNFSLELQREIIPNLTVEIRYVGTKGTKLFDSINLNSVNIFENGLLDAFNQTAAGNNTALFDQMLMGLNIAGVGVVNGTTLTGSQALRAYSTTKPFLANGNVAGLANFLNTTPNFTSQNGGILRNGGLPENFIVANPQYLNATLSGNGSNSTYHSLNISVQKRLSHGFTNQTTYTWSRALGTSVVNPRDRNTKSLLDTHRTHDLRSNGTWELPFGPDRLLLKNASAWITRLVERWQLGGIFSVNSGAPLTLTAGFSPYGMGTGNNLNFPDIVGPVPKSLGRVSRTSTPGVITYFDGLQTVPDPGRTSITNLQTLQSANSNQAIQDASGRILLVNPAPGRLGNMGQNYLEGPGAVNFDANLAKRVRLAESKELVVRLDAVNVLNHPNFGNPTTSINSTSFGRIALPTTGNRQFTFTARLEF